MAGTAWRRTVPDVTPLQRQLARIAPYAVLALFAAFCLTLSYTLNIWQDEAYSLHTSGSGVKNALAQGIGFEAQAPLYFVILAVWRLLGTSALHARALSIICTLIALYTSWHFARRYMKSVNPTVVLGVLALNPFTIWAAVEIRPYAAVLMFSAILVYLFFRGFVDDEPSTVARFAYVFAAILGIYTQYYVALILPANAAALLVLGRPKAFVVYVAAMLAVAAAIIPLAFVVPQQLHAYHAFAVAYKMPKYAIIVAVLQYAFPHNWIGSWTHPLTLNAIYVTAAITATFVVAINTRRMRFTSKVLFTSNAVMFALFTAAIVFADVHVLIPRHSIVMLFPIMLLSIALIGDVAPARRQMAMSVYVLIFVVFAVLSLYHDYHSMAKSGDWRRVASFVTVNAKAADLVAVFNAESELPFRYYYHGPSTVQAIPHSMSFGDFDESTFVLRDERSIAKSFGKVAAGHPRVWLVESTGCSMKGDFFGCQRLEKYAEEHYKAIRTVRFSGSTVVEFVEQRQKPEQNTSASSGG